MAKGKDLGGIVGGQEQRLLVCGGHGKYVGGREGGAGGSGICDQPDPIGKTVRKRN